MIKNRFQKLRWIGSLTSCLLTLCVVHFAQGQEHQAKPAAAGGEKLIIVRGADGQPEYGEDFRRAAERWRKLGESRQWQVVMVGDESHEASEANRELSVKQHLRQILTAESPQVSRLWLVLLGHGTFAANRAKFNLVGPDLEPQELAEWLQPVQGSVVVINCASASAPFLAELGGPNRIVITATKSGSEYNYARFGIHLAEAIDNLDCDLDHDEEVSLLEAFLAGSNRTQRFYELAGRLSTEQALLSDNGDQAGVTADFYRGVVPVKSAQEGKVDGAVAGRVILYASPNVTPLTDEDAARREELESQLVALRARKSTLDESVYYEQLEAVLLQLAKLYDSETIGL